MPFRFRKRIRLWPLPIFMNVSRTGVSFSIKIGPFDWNSRQRAARVDLPGPFYWQQRRGSHPQRRTR